MSAEEEDKVIWVDDLRLVANLDILNEAVGSDLGNGSEKAN